MLSVMETRKALDGGQRAGQIVRVRGYVSRVCYRYGCNLLAVQNQQDGPSLSIAGGTPIERETIKKRGKKVTMLVRLNEARSRTLQDGTIIVTTDRAPEITPIAIEG